MSSPKKNVAYEFDISLIDSGASGSFKVNPTIAAGDFKVSTDNAAFGNLTTLPSVSPAGSIIVKISVSQAEMNGDKILVQCIDVAGGEWDDVMIFIDATVANVDDVVRSTTPANSLDVSAAGAVDLNADQSGVTLGTVTTLTDHTAQTGDSFARLGAPAGVSIAADLVVIDDLLGTADWIRPTFTGTADSSNAAGITDSALTQANDYWIGSSLRLTSGAQSGQTRLIINFDAATDTISVDPNFLGGPGTPTYEILPWAGVDVQSWMATPTSIIKPNDLSSGNVNVNIASTNDIDLSATQKASVNTEVDNAIETYGLDHLVSASVTGADVADDSIIALLVDDAATADWDNYDNTTASLEALNVDADAILVDTGTTLQAELDGIQADTEDIQTKLATVDTVVDSILVDTAVIGALGVGLTAIPWNAAWDAEVQSEVVDALESQITESYADNGVAPTRDQMALATHQMLMDFIISGANWTVRKLDGSTTAFVVTLNDADNPTGLTRT